MAGVDATQLARNRNVVYSSRIWVAGVSGVGAGILGLSGLAGFLFYFLFSIVLLSFLILVKIRFDISSRLINLSILWKEGMVQGISTFVLIWT